MALEDLPFQPVRGTLYSSLELMSGFDPARPESVAEMVDFRIFRYFVTKGRAAPAEPVAGMMEALHDNSILQAMLSFLQNNRKVAAIMGGHDEPRGSDTFRDVVTLSRRLNDAGYMMASGGGPGAMEATHLGAMCHGLSDREVATAIDHLVPQAVLPDSRKVVADNGDVDMAVVRQLHAWALPAYELLADLDKTGKPSLAVPTWYYGHEPATPLATNVAKYFQNSIREDVLLALATNGIIFSPGKAGTLQEVFQSAAKNYYHGEDEPFAPMVFFKKDFWTKELPVDILIEQLFVKSGKADEFHKYVRFTDDIDETVEFITSFEPSVNRMERRLMALGLGPAMQRAAF